MTSSSYHPERRCILCFSARPPPPPRHCRHLYSIAAVSLLSAHLPDLCLSILSLSLRRSHTHNTATDLLPPETDDSHHRLQPTTAASTYRPPSASPHLSLSLSRLSSSVKIANPPSPYRPHRSHRCRRLHCISFARSPTVLAATVCLDLDLSLSADSSPFFRSHTHTNTTTAPASPCRLPPWIRQTQPPPPSSVFTSASPHLSSLLSLSAFDRTHTNTITATAHWDFSLFLLSFLLSTAQLQQRNAIRRRRLTQLAVDAHGLRLPDLRQIGLPPISTSVSFIFSLSISPEGLWGLDELAEELAMLGALDVQLRFLVLHFTSLLRFL